MTNSCVICGGEETEGELLLRAPCGNHWVCHDDVGSFFERATENESLYPPKCCDQIFFLADWEGYIPFEVAWAFQLKEQGEYSVLPKFRVYCANTSCVKFLHSSTHITDESTKITYAICEADNCGSITCITCKNLMETGTQDHMCEISENEKKFKDTAKAEGYQECFLCGSTVELTEACNHITCECGNNFCYICGREWNGLHGCPQYGPAEYDEDGYNQEGYHKETGLNRDGLTYRQQLSRDRGEPEDDEEEGDREDEDGDGDDGGNEEAERPDWDVLQHLGEEERAAIDSLPHEFREDALDMVRVQLFEERGITFNQGGDNATQNDDEPERMDVDEDPENGNEDDNGTDEDGERGIEAVQDNAPTDHDRINEVIVQLSQFEVDHNTEDQLEDDAIGSQGFRSNEERASNPPPLGEMQMEEL